MKVVSAKMPGPTVNSGTELSRSHGMAFVSTVTLFGGSAPTTLLPLLLFHAGPAKWVLGRTCLELGMWEETLRGTARREGAREQQDGGGHDRDRHASRVWNET
jgi:hypothetical protein